MRSGSSAASTYRPVAAPWAASAPGQHTTVAPNAATARHTPSASHVAAAGVTLRDATQSGRPDVELDGSQQLDATSCALALRDATGAAPPGSAVDVAARVELLHALRRWAGSPEAAASSAHGSPLSADVDSLRRCFLVLSHAWSAADAVDAIALGGGSTQPGGLSAGDVATFLEAAYGAFAALIRSPAWPDGALAVPADWMAALCRRIGNPRSRASEVPHLRDVLYWAYRSQPQWRPALRRHLGALLAAAGAYDACWPPPPGLAAALDVTASVLTGLQGGPSPPPSMSHLITLLTDMLLPLYRIPGMTPGEHPPVCALAPFAEPLNRCVCSLIACAPHTAPRAVDAILSAWPPPSQAAAAKGVLLLDATERVIAACGNHLQLAADAVRASLRSVSVALAEQHAGVATRAASLCASSAVCSVASSEGNADVMAALVQALVGAHAAPHWSADVNQARYTALTALQKSSHDRFCAAGDAACAAIVCVVKESAARGAGGFPASPNVAHLMERLRPQRVGEHLAGGMEALSMAALPVLLPDTVGANDLIMDRLLGAGSFGTVHAAKVRSRDVPASQWRQVAVKRIQSAAAISTSTRASRAATAAAREVAALHAVSHPGVARLVTAFSVHADVCLVLELATEGDLHSRLQALGRPLPATNAAFLAGELVAALSAVHKAGLVFGDVKPENVVFTASGHAKLTDFGAVRPLPGSAIGEAAAGPAAAAAMLAQLRRGDWRSLAGLPARDTDAGTGAAVDSSDADEDAEDGFEGTTAYLAPELLLGGHPSEASDAWALGCVLSLCLTGSLPMWSTDSEALMQRIAAWTGDTSALFRSSSVPPEAVAWVTGLLDPSPSSRLGGVPRGGMRSCGTHVWLATSLPCACEQLFSVQPPDWPQPVHSAAASGAASMAVLPRQNSVLYSRRYGGAGGISLGRGGGGRVQFSGPIPQTEAESNAPWTALGPRACHDARPPTGSRLGGITE